MVYATRSRPSRSRMLPQHRPSTQSPDRAAKTKTAMAAEQRAAAQFLLVRKGFALLFYNGPEHLRGRTQISQKGTLEHTERAPRLFQESPL